MKPNVELLIRAGTLRSMTEEQFRALRENVLVEGKWETVSAPVRIDGGGGDYIGVHLPGIFVGIEPDGYTHS